MTKRTLDWTNTLFLTTAHLLGLAGFVYLVAFHFSWWTVALGVAMFALCGLSITGGYHRLFAHPTYKAHWTLRAFYLFFGAAGVQNSALKWSDDHRVHHSRCDQEEDPYNIRRGFWWAHIGWVFFHHSSEGALKSVRDLQKDKLVRLQDRYYVPLAVFSGALLPTGLGFLWGDPVGGLLVGGFLRLVVQWHATFAVNSFTHKFGRQPYCTTNSARDSFLAALITLGEGYHNYHHRFQLDYRNGIRWHHFDPTKWFVYTMSKVGLTRDLRRTPRELIERARETVRAEREARRLTPRTTGAGR